MADNRTPAQKASEAAALMEKLAPIFDELEADSIRQARAAKYWQPEGVRETRHHLDQANALRDLRERIKTRIIQGELDAKRAAV